MEDQDRVQSAELAADNTKIETDDHRVEDDAKLENQECRNLLSEPLLTRLGVLLAPLFDKFLLVRYCNLSLLDLQVGIATASPAWFVAASDSILNVGFGLNAILDLDISLGAEVEEEDDNDRGKDDCGTPAVFGPTASHAYAGLWADLSICRVQKVDECCRDDDTGTEVAWDNLSCV